MVSGALYDKKLKKKNNLQKIWTSQDALLPDFRLVPFIVVFIFIVGSRCRWSFARTANIVVFLCSCRKVRYRPGHVFRPVCHQSLSVRVYRTLSPFIAIGGHHCAFFGCWTRQAFRSTANWRMTEFFFSQSFRYAFQFSLKKTPLLRFTKCEKTADTITFKVSVGY